MTKLAKKKTYALAKHKSTKTNYLTVGEAADHFKVTKITVYGWCKSQLLKGIYQDKTNHWFIPSDSIRPALPEWHFSNKNNPKPTKKKKATKKKSKVVKVTRKKKSKA